MGLMSMFHKFVAFICCIETHNTKSKIYKQRRPKHKRNAAIAFVLVLGAFLCFWFWPQIMGAIYDCPKYWEEERTLSPGEEGLKMQPRYKPCPGEEIWEGWEANKTDGTWFMRPPPVQKSNVSAAEAGAPPPADAAAPAPQQAGAQQGDEQQADTTGGDEAAAAPAPTPLVEPVFFCTCTDDKAFVLNCNRNAQLSFPAFDYVACNEGDSESVCGASCLYDPRCSTYTHNGTKEVRQPACTRGGTKFLSNAPRYNRSQHLQPRTDDVLSHNQVLQPK